MDDCPMFWSGWNFKLIIRISAGRREKSDNPSANIVQSKKDLSEKRFPINFLNFNRYGFMTLIINKILHITLNNKDESSIGAVLNSENIKNENKNIFISKIKDFLFNSTRVKADVF